MPGIPEGTPGKVIIVAGFDWIRYWVRFENGQTTGSINRKKLARPGEWSRSRPAGASGASRRRPTARSPPRPPTTAMPRRRRRAPRRVRDAGVAVPGYLHRTIEEPPAAPRQVARGITMQLSMQLSYAGGFKESARQVAELEKAGLDIAWVAEAYGFDGVSLMGYLAAKTERVQIGAGILPLYTRTPTLLAMTAAGVDALSDGAACSGSARRAAGDRGLPRRALRQAARPHPRDRRHLPQGVGPRGPLTHDGPIYPLPLPEGQGTGLGKPLKIIARPVRRGSRSTSPPLGEKNVELTAEIADGWLPLFFLPEKANDVFGPSLDAGAAKRSPDLGPLDICAGGIVCVGEPDETKARPRLRPARWPPSTSAAWAPRGRTSTTPSCSATATRRRPPRSRTSTSRARRTRRRPRCPTSCSSSTTLCGPEGYIKERDRGLQGRRRRPVPPGHPVAEKPAEARRETQDLEPGSTAVCRLRLV